MNRLLHQASKSQAYSPAGTHACGRAEHPLENRAMATAKSITTDDYKLFPSPRNRHRSIFTHQMFVPYPYMLIDLESYYLKGNYTLFAACRLSDMKMGQLVTLEDPQDLVTFKSKFVPD